MQSPSWTLGVFLAATFACTQPDHSRAAVASADSMPPLAESLLPVYVARRLAPIQWHGGNFDASDVHSAIMKIAGEAIGIRRELSGRGTGYGDEWYFVFVVDSRARPDSIGLDAPGVGDELWIGRSWHMEWRPGHPPPAPDSMGTMSVAAACLFVADDTLLAYSVVTDTTQHARAFANNEHMLSGAGYYRHDRTRQRFVRVASAGPALDKSCRAELQAEGRGP